MLEEFKKAVIKEDYVLLTGNYISALILNQFVYWTKRIYDHDKFVKEELVRLRREDKTAAFPLRSGWIYKTASQLNSELMLDVSDATIHKYLNIILELGLIEQRNNPNHKWDRTLQYRVNLAKLHIELVKIGSGLDGFKTLKDEIEALTDENAFSEFENGASEFENRTTKNSKALPETKTEINIESKDFAAFAAPPPPPMQSTNGKHAFNGTSGKDSPPPSSDAPPSLKQADLDMTVSAMLEAWGRLFPDKSQPRPGTYRSKIKTMLKMPQFKERWLEAMEYAAASPSCQNESWFHFGFFVQQSKGEYGWEKCLRRWMEWKDRSLREKNGNGRTDEWQAIKIAVGKPGKPDISERALRAIAEVPGGWRRFKEQDARFFDQLKPIFEEAYERVAS